MRTVIILFAGAMITTATFAEDARSAANKPVETMACYPMQMSMATPTAPVADGFGTEERFRLKYGRTLASLKTATSRRLVAASVAQGPCTAQCCKHPV